MPSILICYQQCANRYLTGGVMTPPYEYFAFVKKILEVLTKWYSLGYNVTVICKSCEKKSTPAKPVREPCKV